MNNQEIILWAVKKAKDHAKLNGVALGSLVAMEGDKIAYDLVSAEEGLAVLAIHGKIIKAVPMSQIFDVNLVNEYALMEYQRKIIIVKVKLTDKKIIRE